MSGAAQRDPASILQAIPYCRHLGITAAVTDGALLFTMPFSPHLVGNPALPALHGGVIGSLLETSAIAQVMFELGGEHMPKTVDITVDYLRAGRAVMSYARARIARKGRRVVNVHAEMWQEDESKLVAALRGHFLLAQN
jgi:uncharacterized protein (TIGR00369 family)